MNVVDFFRRQTEKWNEENKCGFCWEFDAPLTDAGVNESVMQTNPDECCPVKVFITNYSERPNRQYHPINRFLTSFSIDYTFTLSVVMFDVLGTNVYQEQIGHPISESKWDAILNRIRECICSSAPFDFCEILGKDIQIINQTNVSRINWLDNNYTGWSITITLRDYDCSDTNYDSGS